MPDLRPQAFSLTIAREAWEREVDALAAQIPTLPEHVITMWLTRLVQLRR